MTSYPYPALRIATPLLLLLFLLLLLVPGTRGDGSQALPATDQRILLTATVLENQPTGTEVTRSLAEFGPGLRVWRQDLLAPLFTLTSEGRLVTSTRLDREALCERVDRACVLSLHFTRNRTQVLQLDITILNVNDNRPKFPVSNVKLEMMKTAKVGHIFTLSPAHDKDGDQMTYILLNFRSQFSIKYDKQTDKLILKLLKEIAHDAQDYMLQVSAADHGGLDDHVTIDIRLRGEGETEKESNNECRDHEIELKEDATIGVQFFTFGGGNKVYKLRNSFDLYSIDEVTGSLALKLELDYETFTTQNIEVIIRDTDTQIICSSVVTINVLPVNEYAPEMRSSTSVINIDEDFTGTVPNFYLMVRDLDVMPDYYEIICSIPDEDRVKLIKDTPNYYKLNVMEPIDRERVTILRLIIVCEDSAQPPRSSQLKISLRVRDVNDNTPRFQKALYTAHVINDNTIGSHVITVKATDADVDAVLEYSIEQKYRPYLSINKTTGEITSTRVLSRQRTLNKGQMFTFSVSVSDGGLHTDTTVVVVKFTDQLSRTMAPFIRRRYTYRVKENLSVGTVIGQPTMNISGYENEHLYFTLADGKLTNGDIEIHRNTGQILVAGRLDREREATLTFRLHVYTPRNRHHPLSIAVVLIHLTDVNDNLPELVWPKKPLRVDPARSVGYVIDSVRATDRDLGDNRKLRYRLENQDYIGIDELSGKLFVMSQLPPSGTVIHLQVTISDSGLPRLSIKVDVVVEVTRPQPLAVSGSSSLTEKDILLICVSVSATVVLVVAMLTAIVCLCRKSGRRRGDEGKLSQQKAAYNNMQEFSPGLLSTGDPITREDDLHSDIGSVTDSGNGYSEQGDKVNHKVLIANSLSYPHSIQRHTLPSSLFNTDATITSDPKAMTAVTGEVTLTTFITPQCVRMNSTSPTTLKKEVRFIDINH